MPKNLLVPVDAEPLASAVIDSAVSYSKTTDAQLTFVHVLHANSKQSSGNVTEGSARSVVASAEAAARAAGLPYASVVAWCDCPHEAILEVAEASGCDLIFLMVPGRSDENDGLIGSVSRRVIENSNLPILIAVIEDVVDEGRALLALQIEIRSLAQLRVRLLDADDPMACAQHRAKLLYIERDPEALLDSEREELSIKMLKRRINECIELLFALEQQHRSSAALVSSIRAALHENPSPTSAVR